MLKEKALEYVSVKENPWDRRPEWLALSQNGELPLLLEDEKTLITGQYAITEYVEECHTSPNLLGRTPLERAAVRHMVEWFDTVFYQEVTYGFLNEKVYAQHLDNRVPDMHILRIATENLHYHIRYLEQLTQHTSWLVGEHFSLADIAAACHLSVLDFLGEIHWPEVDEKVKIWYALMKSRPGMRPLLKDKLPGFTPPSYYANPDF